MSNSTTFMTTMRQKPLPWLLLSGLLLSVLFLLYLAPEEATLGTGIRAVYIHVSLIWTGMAGLVLAGLLGLGVAVSANEPLARWMQTSSWVAYGFYLGGILMSAVASKVNWGGVFWQEPRMAASLNSLAVATILLTLNTWVPWVRVRGLLQAIVPVLITWITNSAPLVLHPDNPMDAPEATGIRWAFIGLFLLFSAIAAWIIWKVMKRA